MKSERKTSRLGPTGLIPSAAAAMHEHFKCLEDMIRKMARRLEAEHARTGAGETWNADVLKGHQKDAIKIHSSTAELEQGGRDCCADQERPRARRGQGESRPTDIESSPEVAVDSSPRPRPRTASASTEGRAREVPAALGRPRRGGTSTPKTTTKESGTGGARTAFVRPWGYHNSRHSRCQG